MRYLVALFDAYLHTYMAVGKIVQDTGETNYLSEQSTSERRLGMREKSCLGALYILT